MVKKNSFFEGLNLFNNKSAKKSYNGILIIAGILGVLALSGLVFGFASDAGMSTSSVKLYNESGIEIGNSLLPKQNFSNTYNESISFILRINVSDGAGADIVPDRNITKINITFDNSFIVANYTFNITNGIITTYNITGATDFRGPETFFNSTDNLVKGTTAITLVHLNNTFNGRTFHWLNTTEHGLLGNNTVSSNNQSFYFNISNNVPGDYNITVLLQNGTGTSADSTASRNFSIRINDTTVPQYITLNSNSTGFSSITPVRSTATKPATTASVNFSTAASSATTIYVSVNVTDFNETGAGGIGYAGQGLGNISIVVYNETGLVNLSQNVNRNMTFGTGTAKTQVSLNFSAFTGGANLSDGRYLVTVLNVSDAGNNLNTSVLAYNITIDGTQPTLTVAKASTSTQHQLVLDLTVSDATSGINGKQCTTTGGGTDGITMSGNTGTQTATQTGLGCNTAYTYTTSCTDHSGNTKSTEVTVSTSTCTGGSSSGGTGTGGSGSDVVGSASSSYWTLTYNEATTDLSVDSDGVSVNLDEQYRVKIKVDTKLYYVGVTETTDTTAKLNVTTTAEDKEATLNVGEIKKFDVNADDKYDVAVTLNGIDSATGKADLSLVYIQEPVSAEEQAGVEEQVGEVPTTTPETKSKTWIWIVVILVVLAIAAAILFGKKQSKHKNYGF